MSDTGIKHGVQVKIGGHWQWAGVEQPKGENYKRAHRDKVKMARDPFWKSMGATHFRVRAIPGTGVAELGPRAQAREAQALADALQLDLDKAILERDEARAAAQDFAARLGLEVEW